MKTASLELCQKLFELSGWLNASLSWYRHADDASITWTDFIIGNGVFVCPAYDLSYLLRKFAGKGGIEICYGDKVCTATSHVWTAQAETPENAAALLAIHHFKQGIFETS